MGRYADNFKTACPLESLSWVTMTEAARLGRLASRFLKEEPNLKKLKEKGEWSVTAGVVKPWLLSIYEPPRGGFASLMQSLLEEIERQRKIRHDRADNRPWKWKKADRAERLRNVSRGLYGIVYRNYDKKLVRVGDQRCVGLANIRGILMAVDATPEANLRVYMRHQETGRVKVVILDIRTSYSGDNTWSLTSALLKLAPAHVQHSLFGGHIIAPDFERNGFTVDGVFHAWRHVAKIVEGAKKVKRTPKQVEKKAEEKATSEDEDENESEE